MTAPHRSRRSAAVTVLLAAVAFACAFASDGPVHRLTHDGTADRFFSAKPVAYVARMPGNFPLALACGLLLLAFHRRRVFAFTLLAASSVVSACVAGLFKGVFGRARPDTWPGTPHWVWFRGGWYGLFHQKNVGFVSGDVTQAFAWAAAMSLLVPALRVPVYAWALVTAAQRVSVGAHWPSDAVGAAVVGVVTVRTVARILRPLTAAADGPAFEVIPRPQAEPLAMPDASLDPSLNPASPYLSLVIPCYNEQENVPTLLSRVEASMNTLGKPYEVVIVDDGSTDRTPAMLAEAKTRLPWLRVLRMGKNSGQSAGFEAGFGAARGRFIATIDADLQNDPEEVPRLVEMLDADPDADMITGWRKERQDTNFRRWQSRQANKIRNWISQDDINDSASSLKVYRAEVVKGLKLFNGAHRFFPALAKMRGFRVKEVPVKHSQRFAGTAKYGFRNRAFRAFIDLLGIRWMKMRYLNYAAQEVPHAAETA